MATTSLVAERVAQSVASLPATELRRIRALADAGLIPKGPAGGAGKKADYEEQALAFVALAQAGGSPVDAPAVVERLRGLVDETSGQTLLDYIIAQVQEAATSEGRARLLQEIEGNTQRGVPLRELTLAPSGPIAWESLHAEDGETRRLRRFVIPASIRPGNVPSTIRRLTTISIGLFVVLGDLYADTLMKRGRALPDLEPGSAPGEHVPTSENENADLPGPASTRKSRTTAKQSQEGNTPEIKTESDFAQPCRAAALVTSHS